MKKALLSIALMLVALGASAGIDPVGASVEIVPSKTHGGVEWSAPCWVVDSPTSNHDGKSVGIPGDDANGNKWYDVDYAGGVTDQVNDGCTVLINWEDFKSCNSFGNGDDADVYIRREFTWTEAIDGTVYLSCAHDDAPAEYYLNGVKIFGIENGWNDPKYYPLSVEEKALIKTDGSKNVLAAHVHQNWGGASADLGLYATTEPQVATPKANPVYVQGMTPTEGTFYIYHPATGKWLGDNFEAAGNIWTSRGAITHIGRDIKLRADGEGFKLDFSMAGTKSLRMYNRNGGGMDMVTDADDNTVWKFEPVEGKENVYYITAGDNGIITVEPGLSEGGLTMPYGRKNEYAEWQIVTRDQRIAMATAKKALSAEPVDMSWAILGGTFPVNDNHTVGQDGVWKGVPTTNKGQGQDRYKSILEMYSLTDLDMNQTITGLPNGIYKVSAKAAYVSTGDNNMNLERYNAYKDGTEPTLGKVYANDKSVDMINAYDIVSTEKVSGKNEKEIIANEVYVPGSTAQFRNHMFEGGFAVEEMEVEVTDGTLKVGVKVEGATAGWVLIDDFTLTYLGEAQGLTEGTYFFYNVGTGKWLGDNLSNPGIWTSFVDVNERGRDFKLTAGSGESTWKIHTNMNSSVLRGDLWMDTGEKNTEWTFTPVEGKPGVYTITTGDNILSVGSNGYTTSNKANAVHSEWKIFTKEERLEAVMNSMSPENPVDLSWLVLGGTFPVADDHKKDGTWIGMTDKDNNSDGKVKNRIWIEEGVSDKDIYQVINVPNGEYKVSAQAIYCPTAIDKLNIDDYNAFIGGTKPTLGVIYANEGSVPMVNVYETVESARVADRKTRELASDKWTIFGVHEASAIMYEGQAKTQEVTVTVTDGILRVGAKVSGASSAVILLDNFTVKCVSTGLDLTIYLDALNEAITNAEGILANTSTTTALKARLEGAITAAKEALNATDSETISAATAAVNSAANEVSGGAASYEKLNQLVTICEAELATVSHEGFAAAVATGKTALADATTAAELMAPVSKIVMYRRIAMGGCHNYTMESTEPADQLEAYIYNVGAGLFLAGGNDWGTHASLNYASRSMILHANTHGENAYSIQTNLPNGARGVNDWLGHNGYVDVPKGDVQGKNGAWVFEPVGDGSYRIINAQNAGANIYFGMTEDERLQVDTDKSGADNKFNHWKLITKAQIEALMNEASEENPVDVTYNIHQSTFSQNDFNGGEKGNADGHFSDSSWNFSFTGEEPEHWGWGVWNWKGNEADGDYVCEIWQSGNMAVALSQTITDLKPGNYRVSVNGLYRDGSFAHASTVADNPEKWAILTANDAEPVYLPAITECADMYPGLGRLTDDKTMVFPDNCKDAAKYFQVGLYRTEIEATVGKDGVLTIGVSKERLTDVVGDDWVLVDNFRLAYLGNPSATGIEDVETAGNKSEAIYNLQGQKLTKAVKGVNIINGKKVIVK